jgi:hypothetical protein
MQTEKIGEFTLIGLKLITKQQMKADNLVLTAEICGRNSRRKILGSEYPIR